MLTSHCKETKQPHKKIKVDWFFWRGEEGEGGISRYTPVATALTSTCHAAGRPYTMSVLNWDSFEVRRGGSISAVL